jgi:Tfp pilus assembly protein PilN
MTEIDFLPVEYWNRRASRRDQWYLLGIGVASIVLLMAAVVHESSNSAQLRAQLSSLETEYQDATVYVEEVKRLENTRAPLAFDAKLQTLLRARPALSRAMVGLATSCPSRLTLNAIRLKSVIVAQPEQRTAVAAGRGTSATNSAAPADLRVEHLERFATQRELTRVTIELTGVAESDLELAEFMERLENAGCFTEVALGNSADSPSAGMSELREFKIQCRLLEVF